MPGLTRRLLAGALAIGLLSAGCSDTSSTESVKVGTLYPTTGAQATGGTEEERGVQLAAEWANDHGGIRGRRVRLVSANAERAEDVPRAMADLRRRGVTTVIGSHGSAISAAAAHVASREGLSFFETGAVGQLGPGVAGGDNFFRLAPMGANLGTAAIAFVRDHLGAKLGATGPLRYAVAYVDDPYGRSVGLGAAGEVERSGQVLATTLAYDARSADYAALAARVGEARPDVLFVAAYLDDGVALRRALVAGGVPLRASIGTSSSYCMPSFGAMLGDDAVGLFASDKPDAAEVRADALSPEGRRTLDWVRPRYERRHHEPMSAPALSGFSNAHAVLAHVLPRAASLDAREVSVAALAVKLPVGSLANGGGLDLAPPGAPDAGDNRNAASVIWEWVSPRTRAVVWPPAMATHPVVALPLKS